MSKESLPIDQIPAVAPKKKKLLVKVADAPDTTQALRALGDAKEEPLEEIQAPKKPDMRGKGAHIMDNLAKGREKLAALREANKKVREELAEKALQKKLSIAQRQKEKIMKDFGLDSLSSDEEEEVEEKPIKKAPKAAPAPKAKAEVKVAPKKKVVRYVEEESEESEPEVVYVKRERKGVSQATTPRASHSLVFY
jgi:hypothetical protein